MADRYTATIEIGGNITPELHAKLYDALRDCDEIAGGTGEPLTAFEVYATNGAMPDVEAFCREHGLTYVRTSEAYCEFSGCASWWKPGMDAPKDCHAANDGTPMVSVEAIRDRIDCERGGLIEWLDEHTPCDVPPLVVTDAVPVS